MVILQFVLIDVIERIVADRPTVACGEILAALDGTSGYFHYS